MPGKAACRLSMIARTLDFPSTRFRISPELPGSFTMPSGYSSTCACCAGSHWKRKWRCSSNTVSSSNADVSAIGGRPDAGVPRQHVELELQDAQRACLLGAGAEMVQGHAQAVLHVATCFGEALAEIEITLRVDPRVELRPVLQALLVDFRREQLGERGAHGLLPR